MTKQEYKEYLKDPRWKAKRLLVLKRDGKKCKKCGANVKLHVHHIKYTGMPWEAPFEDLITLCKICHIKEHMKPQESKNNTYKSKQEVDRFYMVYMDYMATILGETSGNDIKVLIGLAQFLEYDSNKVRLTPDKRRQLAELLQFTPQTLSNTLNVLKKKNLIKGSRGDYELDPRMVWYGSTKTREALLKEGKGLQVNIRFEGESGVV